MLEVVNVSHGFAGVPVLDQVSFTLGRGEVLGFLGPNGAGKTTTMRIITGYLRPDSGEVVFDGKSVAGDPMALRRNLGYLPENVPVYPELRVGEHLDWVAGIKRSQDRVGQVAYAMDVCGLNPVAGKLVGHLSRGYRQRLGLAQALLGESRLLVLDEPTVGLDPVQIREIRNLIKKLGQDRTILLSTHILSEVELVCDRVVIINKGRIAAEEATQELTDRAKGRCGYLLRVDMAPDRAKEAASALVGADFVESAEPLEPAEDDEQAGAVIRVRLVQGDDRRADLSRLVMEQGFGLLEFRPDRAGLEEVFVSLTREESGDRALEGTA
jgi:ABC-2 type transport system ATP-binding protein